jgi:hypothetical protein
MIPSRKESLTQEFSSCMTQDPDQYRLAGDSDFEVQYDEVSILVEGLDINALVQSDMARVGSTPAKDIFIFHDTEERKFKVKVWVEKQEEKDPNGIGQHEPGAKLDQGKTMAHVVLGAFSQALTEVAKVGTFGANKYTKYGWEKVENGVERYSDAMLRHYLAEAGGEPRDDQTDLPHAAHLAWNALARLELMLRDKRGENPPVICSRPNSQ